ncbi:MAG: CoA ester lyase [Burkholderiales bacterium]|nr:CoA ester lyase [Burkholderiales bacterium]
MSAPDVGAARAALFTPGNRSDRFARAAASGADALILDLEDAVAAAEKDRAREGVLAHFAGDFRSGLASGQMAGLRINNVHTAAGLRDLAALADARIAPDFVMLPKLESAFEVRLAARHIARRTALVCAIESARGLEAAIEIARADPRVRALAMGGADLAVSLRAENAWEALLFARSRLVQAAAAAGIGLLDSPHFELADEAGLAESSRRARALGFTGRLAVHPRQVPVIQAAFTPTPEEVARAERIVAALAAAGGNVCELDGEMVEGPIVRAAERILAAARSRSVSGGPR